MIPRSRPQKNRLRRTMMFTNVRRPGLIKGTYIYETDSITLDLEDVVTEDQKDAVRFSLFQALKHIDYGDTEVIVRVNELDTPHWQEDIHRVVTGDAGRIRIAECESAQDVRTVEEHTPAARREFGVEEGGTLLIAVLESPRGIMSAHEIVTASDRVSGCAISGGDLRKGMHVQIERDGIEMLAARGQMLLAARVAGVQCSDTMYPNIDNMDGFKEEVIQNRKMRFDGKSIVSPKQVRFVYEIFAPTAKGIAYTEKLVRSFNEQVDSSVGVYTADNKVVDIPFFGGARRVIALAKACGMYKGDLQRRRMWRSMTNAVRRDTPDEPLVNGEEIYQGKYYMDGKYAKKGSPNTRRSVRPLESKVCGDIREVCERCGIHDGTTSSFHTEFKNGDYMADMVAKALVEEIGSKGITVAATSLGNAQGVIVDYIEDGRMIRVQTPGVRGRIGEVISAGRLKTPVVIRNHGGRPRAVEAGEIHIDIALLAVSTSDYCGNAKGVGGKNNCGSMGFAIHDSHFADHMITIADILVPFPNLPSSISAIDVDCVYLVDDIDDAGRISTKEARMTDNPREPTMTEHAVSVIAATPCSKDGFSLQADVGGPSLAVNRSLEEHMLEKNIWMSFALGEISSAVCRFQDKRLVKHILDTQDFSQGAINHIFKNPNHHETDLDKYANPASRDAYVSELDFVVLFALKIDTDLNVNVITGSDGVLRGAPGGYPDTAVGSKYCIIVISPTRGHMVMVCDEVVAVTTSGDCVDVLMMDYGIAMNSLRHGLIDCLDAAGIVHVTIRALRDKAYGLVGTPDRLEWEDQVVTVVGARDGTILDMVREIRPLHPD